MLQQRCDHTGFCKSEYLNCQFSPKEVMMHSSPNVILITNPRLSVCCTTSNVDFKEFKLEQKLYYVLIQFVSCCWPPYSFCMSTKVSLVSCFSFVSSSWFSPVAWFVAVGFAQTMANKWLIFLITINLVTDCFLIACLKFHYLEF